MTYTSKTVIIFFNKPNYPNTVEFVRTYPVRTTETDQRLKEIFAEAFNKANPTYKLLIIKVVREG